MLTCGGFENNPTMVRTYLDGLPHCYPAGTPYNTGDGITHGHRSRRGSVAYDQYCRPGILLQSTRNPGIPLDQPSRTQDSYLFVGNDGKRFTAEGHAVHGRRSPR